MIVYRRVITNNNEMKILSTIHKNEIDTSYQSNNPKELYTIESNGCFLEFY